MVGTDQKDSSLRYSLDSSGRLFPEMFRILRNAWFDGGFTLLRQFSELLKKLTLLRADGLSCFSAMLGSTAESCSCVKLLSFWCGSGRFAVDIGSGMCKAGLLVSSHTTLCSLDCRFSSTTVVAVTAGFAGDDVRHDRLQAF